MKKKRRSYVKKDATSSHRSNWNPRLARMRGAISAVAGMGTFSKAFTLRV